MIGHFFFAFYCLQAGPFLLVAPWTLAWDRLFLQTPIPGLCLLCTDPLVLSLISGFGVLHLVWGLHDLDLALQSWARRREGVERAGAVGG